MEAKCDACAAIAFSIEEAFKAVEEAKQKARGGLSVHVIMELLTEIICEPPQMKRFGEAVADWLSRYCKEIVAEVGESEIYEIYATATPKTAESSGLQETETEIVGDVSAEMFSEICEDRMAACESKGEKKKKKKKKKTRKKEWAGKKRSEKNLRDTHSNILAFPPGADKSDPAQGMPLRSDAFEAARDPKSHIGDVGSVDEL